MDIYARFGVRRRINAAGTLTRLGGSLMPDEVLDAMRAAARSSVDVAELQAAASRLIAAHTGAEAGLVTAGAAAALTVATAACLTGLDVARMERLPDTRDMPNEVIMCRTHRTGYDHAVRLAGAVIRDIGFNDLGTGAGVRDIEPWEIEAAITPRTAAFAYTATPRNMPRLAEVAGVCARHRIPVIVDAAAQLPPTANLRRFIAEGAALVCFSGGKAIQGPQGTGILAGRRELVAAALLQQIDMDVRADTWSPPEELVPPRALAGYPHHGIGRGFKVGKEDIVGLMTALERFATRDEQAYLAAKEAILADIARRLSGLNGLALRRLAAGETGRMPLLELRLDQVALGRSAVAVARALQAGEPAVHVGEARLDDGVLLIDAAALSAEHAAPVAGAVRAALTQT